MSRLESTRKAETIDVAIETLAVENHVRLRL